MTKFLNLALKIKGGGREGGTCEVLRPCHPPKIWNVHQSPRQPRHAALALKLDKGRLLGDGNHPRWTFLNLFF